MVGFLPIGELPRRACVYALYKVRIAFLMLLVFCGVQQLPLFAVSISIVPEVHRDDATLATFDMEIQDDIDKKPRADIIDDAVPAPAEGSKLTVPPLVAAMSQEERVTAEAKLRKKIDTRLLPMIILMYIMNYLDRNNIAAVRLAGLQDELNLSSVQYQVGSNVPSEGL